MVKNLPANSRDVRDRFNPRIRKIPWRRERQSSPVFLPVKSHGQRRLVGYRGVVESQKRLSNSTHQGDMCRKCGMPSRIDQ